MTPAEKRTTTEPDSKQRILMAAVRLFARQGYGNTGLRELAKAADVNLAMINYFFGSKKTLLKEILNTFFSGYIEVARRKLAGADPPEVKLKRFIHDAVIYFSNHSDYLLVTIAELPHDDPEITEHKAAWGRKMVETVSTLMGKPIGNSHADEGIAPVIFCSTLTSLMASRFLFTPVMEQVQPEKLQTVSIEEYAEIISKIVLQGMPAVVAMPED